MANLDITLGNTSDASGRFNFVKDATGDVSFDVTQAHAVMTAAMERRGGYWAAPNQGSELSKIQSITTRTPSQSQAAVLDALTTLERNQVITNVAVTSTVSRNKIGGGALGITISWTTPGGLPQQVSI